MPQMIINQTIYGSNINIKPYMVHTSISNNNLNRKIIFLAQVTIAQ